MEQDNPLDVLHCWQRLCNLVDWSLQTQTDPRKRAAAAALSLLASDNQAHIDQLWRMVSKELDAQNAYVPLGELQRQSAWKAVLEAANAALKRAPAQ